MNKYEATFILTSDVQGFENGKSELKKEFESAGIKVLKEEDKGDQALTYPIKKNARGHYVFFELEAPSQSVAVIDKALRIKPEILKHLFIRV